MNRFISDTEREAIRQETRRTVRGLRRAAEAWREQFALSCRRVAEAIANQCLRTLAAARSGEKELGFTLVWVSGLRGLVL